MNYLSRRLKFLVPALFLSILLSCSDDETNEPSVSSVDDSLASLPEDTGGVHIAKVLGSTSAAFGYYIYLPGGYNESKANYPVMVFLHGKSERGDGTDNPEILDKVLRNGPPKMIEKGEWSTTYPMIVVSPQYHGTTGNANNWGAGDADNLKEFIEHLLSSYRINKRRIYLTGLSHGGNGVYDYLTNVEDSVNYIAAAAPVAAYGAKKGVEKSRNTPVWVFVGDKDGANVSTSKEFVRLYNEQQPVPVHRAKISVYNNVGHDVWTRTYNGEGMGTVDSKYDPFDMSLYDWMFQFERPE
ncbi:hypothetical protein GCM10011506_36710 [Marivirga lumbricoides]|uniref:Uncharacterized protein n=1 Tax=Marivirga lumbricoides TaxID=1046115 RepID=A0ABQ1N0D0_9BACT|nr:hypothetical protein GCM10011506_36710 [Marivirga lumbricoides]